MEKIWCKSGKLHYKFPFKQEAGDFSRTTPIFSFFLHKQVVIKVEEGFIVSGRLISYQLSNGFPGHRPSVLILENLQGQKVLVRGSFIFIATTEKETFTNVKKGDSTK